VSAWWIWPAILPVVTIRPSLPAGGHIVAPGGSRRFEVVTMTKADMARLENVRKRLQALGCRLIEPVESEGFYIRDEEGSIVTARGRGIELEAVELWVASRERRLERLRARLAARRLELVPDPVAPGKHFVFGDTSHPGAVATGSFSLVEAEEWLEVHDGSY
jgi:hypothetical protein